MAQETEKQIEVTPEMIEAGALVLRAWEPMFDFLGEEAAENVFRAMEAARLGRQ